VLFILTKKGQTWYMDYIFGIFIFSICLILYYKFIPNLEAEELNNLEEIYLDAKTISESIVSQGYPQNWTNETVHKIGILSHGKTINHSKFIEFNNMALDDYNKTRMKFNVHSEFIIFFTDINDNPINLSNIYKIGNPKVTLTGSNNLDLSGINQNNLVSITRILIYNKSTIKMVAYSWQ
jgi:hypothetical protein